MSSLSPALAFPLPSEPLVLAAARELKALLDAGEPIGRTVLNDVLAAQFGGSDAEGRWSIRDAHAALELAQVLWLQSLPGVMLGSSPADAANCFDRLESLLPPQHVRSDEQIELQQFATPPRLAWLAARACAIRPKELVLEPSAGTGMLAVWAQKSRARLALNEISPLRRECLEQVFPEAAISGHDGELIDELLSPELRPSVVLMNPPYSHGLERGADGRTGRASSARGVEAPVARWAARRDHARVVRHRLADADGRQRRFAAAQRRHRARLRAPWDVNRHPVAGARQGSLAGWARPCSNL